MEISMDFELKEEYRMLKDLVARFVKEDLLTLEPTLLKREAETGAIALTEQERKRIDDKSRDLGLWGLDAPEEIGGADLPVTAMVGVNEEIGHSIVHYYLPPDTPNLRLLMLTATPEQKERYLEPYVRGEIRSAIVISEPGAGGDPSGISSRAIRDGDHWVINGRKIWISNIEKANFGIVMARTSGSPGSRGGISAFIVDVGTPGFLPTRKIPMIGGGATWEVVFENCRVHESQLLGVENQGFAPMQARLSARRVQMAAWAVGKAQRALSMLCEYAPQRKTFGVPLSERQAIQWWIADAATRIHAARLMTYECAWRIDRGLDARTQTSMIKSYATEMAWEVIDRAMQTFGAMGMTKELPLQQMANAVRLMRIYEGPTEVHRMVVARNILSGTAG
jgi:acyl-CoA dehydrogenase